MENAFFGCMLIQTLSWKPNMTENTAPVLTSQWNVLHSPRKKKPLIHLKQRNLHTFSSNSKQIEFWNFHSSLEFWSTLHNILQDNVYFWEPQKPLIQNFLNKNVTLSTSGLLNCWAWFEGMPESKMWNLALPKQQKL